MTTMTLDKHWTELGLCDLDNAHLFTPGPVRGGDKTTRERETQIAYVVNLCLRCPVLDWCAAWASTRTDLDGQIVAGIYHE